MSFARVCWALFTKPFGSFVGLLWFDVFRIRRDVALQNLERAFPDWNLKRRTQVARASLFCMGQTIAEYALFPLLNEKRLREISEIQGEQHLQSAFAGGKGVLILSLHLGNGDLAIASLSRRGYKMNLISKLFKNRWLNDLWFGMRAKHGTRFIAPEKSSFDILKALKRKEAVVFVLDQFMGPPVGVRTKFFGHETGTAAGLATIALRTGAPVLPSYDYRKTDGKHVVVFEAPIHDQSLTDENIARITQTYTDKIEAIIRQHPEQWMWIHRRWKEFRE
jgi:KDO2-lipid IV(A) lauroyltransferase